MTDNTEDKCPWLLSVIVSIVLGLGGLFLFYLVLHGHGIHIWGDWLL